MSSLDAELSRNRGSTDLGQDVEVFDAPDLSPQDFAEHTANAVASAFQATKLYEVVEVKAGVGQVHLLGRVRGEDERTFTECVVKPALAAMRKVQCDGFIGKQFFLKDHTDKLYYGWVVSFAANDLKKAAYAIGEALEPMTPKVEVTESPLVGPGTPNSGGRGSGRKGAAPLG